MFFNTKDGSTTSLFPAIPASPPTDAELAAAADVVGNIFMEAVAEDETKSWFKVKARLGLADREGWVSAIAVEPADPPELEPVDPWSFVKSCTLAARVTNAAAAASGHGINRDFMIAYALEQTGTPTAAIPTNIETGAGDEKRIGPFAMTATEWDAFVRSAANDSGFQASDIRTPVFQCYGFAFHCLEATRAISAKFSVGDPMRGSGPYVPSTTELFVYLAMGEKAAFKYIEKLAAGAGAEKAHLLLEDAPEKPGLLARYARFFGTEANAATIQDFDLKLAALLDEDLKRAFTLVRDNTPEDIIYFASGTLPWLVKAREELTKEVAEAGNPPNPEVMKYFKATALAPDSEIPWCGAFVAWCLANCASDRAAASIVKATAATAASWKTWGDAEVAIGSHEKDAVPLGAIVVLRPQTADASGHVGFFVGQTSSTVTLLAGNQSNRVNETVYNRREVVAMRMLKGFDFAPTVGSGPGTIDPNFEDGTLGPFTKEDWAIYTDVLGHSESRNKYTAVNRFGYSGRWQFGAGALIDGGYVKAGAATRVLKQNRWWTGKNDVTGRAAWLGNLNRCQDLEMIAYTKRNYRSLMNIKATRHFVEGVSKSRLAGLLATSHLLGAGGTRKFVLGQDSADANGTTASKYFGMMSKAFGGGASLN